MDVDSLFSVAGKVAVVTGGSRGIGAMIAEGFVRGGATVYISSRKAAECDATAARLGELGPCTSLPADLSTEEGRAAFVGAFGDREEGLDVLVNNAGATWGAPLDEYPASAWDKLVGINLAGVFEVTQALLPALRSRATQDDPARVINIGSIDGLRVPEMETYAYSATKSAVHMLTRHLARRLGPEWITVNAVAPGPFHSKMMAFVLDDHEDAVAATVPLRRVGRPDDMAGVALFLASRAGSYVNGAVVPVDGGIVA